MPQREAQSIIEPALMSELDHPDTDLLGQVQFRSKERGQHLYHHYTGPEYEDRGMILARVENGLENAESELRGLEATHGDFYQGTDLEWHTKALNTARQNVADLKEELKALRMGKLRLFARE